MRRRTTLIALASCSIAALASPALAHVSFEQKTLPPNSDQVIRMNAPVEAKDHGPGRPDPDARHNERLTVEIPAGFTARACESKPGWTCKVNPAAGKTPHHVAYTRTGPPFEAVDSFNFTVHTASAAGNYPFETNQTYSDGDTSHWDGPPDSPTPAPMVSVG